MKKHMTYTLWKRTISCISLFLAFCLILSPCVVAVYAADDPGINWDRIPSHTGTGNIYTWSVAKGEGGYYFYVVGNQWSQGTIEVIGKDWSSYSLIFWPYDARLQFGWGDTKVEGATITREFIDGNAHFKAFVPESAFPKEGFQLSCGETVLPENIPNVADIPGAGGGENPNPPQPPATEPSGSESGGSESGGTETGGTETGGTETGGTETGGTETGGTETGGTETGGTGSGGSDPSIEPSQAPETPQTPAGYNGIVIDGNFDDWAAVSKTDVQDKDINGNPKGWSTIEHAAMVWDGDYIYLYLAADGDAWHCGNWNSVCSGGTHNNGQYAIVTDLGYQLLVQPKDEYGNPVVAGINGATAAVNNKNWDGAPHCWEIAIPASALPTYQKTISFGFYLGEPIISNVANLQGGGSGGKFEGVHVDGNYSDWTYYPHTTIQYATAGNQEHVEDSNGAAYCKNGTLYAHAQTTMPQHLEEGGGEFTQAVTIKFNDTEKLEFAPRFIAVDSNGNINWDPPRQGLPYGRYEYYLVSLDAPGSSKNIHALTPGDEIYGRAIVTVGASQDQCEWEMDLAMLANHLRPNVEGTVITRINPNDIKSVSVQWGRLGQEWVTTVGTSTGPLVGILLCLCAVAVPTALSRRKRKAICGISFALFS